MEESGGSGWGFYDIAQLPSLMAWLESGSDAEQELADRIHETFKAHLQPVDDPQARPCARIEVLVPRAAGRACAIPLLFD